MIVKAIVLGLIAYIAILSCLHLYITDHKRTDADDYPHGDPTGPRRE